MQNLLNNKRTAKQKWSMITLKDARQKMKGRIKQATGPVRRTTMNQTGLDKRTGKHGRMTINMTKRSSSHQDYKTEQNLLG